MKGNSTKTSLWRVGILGAAIIGVLGYGYFKRARNTHTSEEIGAALRLSKSILPSGSAREMNLQLGMKLVKDKQFEAARKVFEELLVMTPTDVSVLNNLAFVAGEEGQMDRAANYLQTAIQISDHCAECFNNLGSVLYKQNKGEEARGMFQRAVALDPKYIDPKLNLAVMAEEQSDWISALEWYKQVLPEVTDPEMRKWIEQRSKWMTEISQTVTRGVASQK